MLVLASAIAIPGNAVAADMPATGDVITTGTGPHCATLVHRESPSNPKATPIKRVCASTQAEALAQLPAARVPLITVYQHYEWQGESDTITGDWGNCDAAGYQITDLSWSNFLVSGITSYVYHSECSGATTYRGTNFTDICRHEFGHVKFVGDKCNDHVWSMRVYKYYA